MILTWFYRSLEGEQCSNLGEPSTTQFVVSCGLIGWVLLCYIPQWARIVSRRSAEGISALYILLGSLSGACAVGNIFMLPSSIVKIGCCRSNARFACINNLLGMFQVTFGIVCFWIVLFMYYYYSKEETDLSLRTTANAGRPVRQSCQALQVLLMANSFAILILIVSAIILHYFPQLSQTWADILGISLAVGACLQWLPQIVTTWRLGNLGSLSPASLFFMAPYTWIFGANMIIRVGMQDWSAWTVYVLVGTMQLVLIGFAIIFHLRPSDQQVESDGLKNGKADLPLRTHPEMSQSILMSHADENCPLLASTKLMSGHGSGE